MHFYFFARGVIHQIELWKTLMQNQFFIWKRKNLKTGEETKMLVQAGLRPSVLGCWEYVFPKECLCEVLSMMGVQQRTELYEKTFLHKSGMTFLRKILTCRNITDEEYKISTQIPHSITINGRLRGLSSAILKGVMIHPIGVKEDEIGIMQRDIDENGMEVFFAEGYEQEML